MHDGDLEQRLEAILRRAPMRRQVLQIAQSLALPDWVLGAGFIRAAGDVREARYLSPIRKKRWHERWPNVTVEPA